MEEERKKRMFEVARFSKTLVLKASWVAFDAFGDLLFVNSHTTRQN